MSDLSEGRVTLNAAVSEGPTFEGDDASTYPVEIYMRVNITKNTKGYSWESTVSASGVMSHDALRSHIRNLLIMADEEIRLGIEYRVRQEIAAEGESPADPAPVAPAGSESV